MTELTVQYAIRMPNGELYCRHEDGFFGGLFGPPSTPTPVVFDSREAAERTLESARTRAQQMGITEWFGVVVQRFCTPFTAGDPGVELLRELQEWRLGEGR